MLSAGSPPGRWAMVWDNLFYFEGVMSTDILRFKRGETVEISVVFDVLDDLGISALTGVTAAAELRRKYTKETVARFQTTLYPEIRLVLLRLDADVCRSLMEGHYVFDLQFTRRSDGLVQYSGDIPLEILKSTSNVG